MFLLISFFIFLFFFDPVTIAIFEDNRALEYGDDLFVHPFFLTTTLSATEIFSGNQLPSFNVQLLDPYGNPIEKLFQEFPVCFFCFFCFFFFFLNQTNGFTDQKDHDRGEVRPEPNDSALLFWSYLKNNSISFDNLFRRFSFYSSESFFAFASQSQKIKDQSQFLCLETLEITSSRLAPIPPKLSFFVLISRLKFPSP